MVIKKSNKCNNIQFSIDEIEGKGIIQDLQKGFKNITKPVNKIINKVEDYGKAIIYGRNDYPPKVRDILSKYGNEVVQSLTIMRTPVPKVLTGALSLFSFGKFGKRLENNFDELFHLFLEIITTTGKHLSIEKNEVINMDINPEKRDKTEMKSVSIIPSQLTINQMLDRTKEYMGSRYFTYSARDNNCQDFLVSIFKANNIGNEQDINFIKQDTKQLFENLPYLRKIANTATDLGAKVNIITTGAGLENKNYVVQSIIFYRDKWTTTEAKKWLKENGYKIPGVDKKENTLRFRQLDPNLVEKDGFTEFRTIELGDNSGILLILAYKKNKISKNNIMGRKPKSKELVSEGEETPKELGGVICSVCKHHIEGGKIDVGGAFKKLGKDIKKGFTKEIIKPIESKVINPIESKVIEPAASYITAKKGGLATDLIKYGIPAASSAVLGGLATVATEGNPVAGVAGSALGSKLGTIAASELQKATGTGMTKRKGRFEKGSPEAIAWGKAMREKKLKKN